MGCSNRKNKDRDFNEEDVEIVDDDLDDEAEKEAKEDEGKEDVSADELDETLREAAAEAKELPREKATVSLDEPGLQMPKPAKSDWKAEMVSIKKLVGSASSGKQTKQFHDTLTQQIEDIRALEEAKEHFKKKIDDLQSEAQRCRTEEARLACMKTRLETTCQELQEQKKTIADENRKIAEEERQRHAELKEKFERAIKDVQEKMDAEYEVRQHFVKENDELRTKLAKFTETFEEQENHVAEQREARGREMQLKKKRLIEYEATVPKSKVKTEKLEKQNEVLRKTQAVLRAQLQPILAKFDEVHASVTGSNEQHSECKTEIDKLQTELTELENDNADLRANAQLSEMEKERDVAKKQRDALEKLCDNLNKECAKQRDLLKAAKSGKAGG
jgi:chromosome segregation ATPase